MHVCIFYACRCSRPLCARALFCLILLTVTCHVHAHVQVSACSPCCQRRPASVPVEILEHITSVANCVNVSVGSCARATLVDPVVSQPRPDGAARFLALASTLGINAIRCSVLSDRICVRRIMITERSAKPDHCFVILRMFLKKIPVGQRYPKIQSAYPAPSLSSCPVLLLATLEIRK